MKAFLQFLALAFLVMNVQAATTLPKRYVELVPYVQAAPDQGETNTCWFVASTGAMELLLNRRDGIKNPKAGSKNDLSESFIIFQNDFYDESIESFVQDIFMRFNYHEAVHISKWPFKAKDKDGNDIDEVWWKHQNYNELPRLKTPSVKTHLVFDKSYGNRWTTEVLEEKDLLEMKKAMYTKRSPLIVNYNDDYYWHVVLIVGYDDDAPGECYELEKKECNKKGSFYVRDSNGKRVEKRAYNWFLKKGNAAATAELVLPKKTSKKSDSK